MRSLKNYNSIFIFTYAILLLLGVKTLFHGFPDIERFFAEWMDERITLNAIMKFGTLDFTPTIIMHPPLYHYITFIPIGVFFAVGRAIGLFYDKVDFVRFYFSNMHYFFFIGRMMSYIFYWASAAVTFKITRLFYNRIVSHITVLSFLLIPRFIFDFSTTRPETLLFLNTSIFLYFFLRYYLDNKKIKYLFLAAFFLGVSAATKYNALYLGVLFIPLLFFDIRDMSARHKNYRRFFSFWAGTASFIFLGFFICNPFFFIQFGKYFHNLMTYGKEVKYYWQGFSGLNHFQELISFMYVNFFGFLILVFGSWAIFRKDKRLAASLFLTILAYELYFGVFFKNVSPLRYLNPLLPIMLLILGSGISFIIESNKKLVSVIVVFGVILFYNYMDIWKALSLGPTHIQKARAFIENTIPEFTTICITSYGYVPQLNMTEASYHHLIETTPIAEDIPGYELDYKDMDNEERYRNVFRELRIASLMKRPMYNLIRWDNEIKTANDAMGFIERNNIGYIIAAGEYVIDGKKIDKLNIASLIKEFRPKNRRIYRAVYGDVSLFLYRVNDINP